MKAFYVRKTSLKKYSIVGFDIETITSKNKFYMGGLYDDDGYHSFFKQKEMLDFLLSKRYTAKNTIIYATNLSFDFFGLLNDDARINNCAFTFRGSQLLQVKYKIDKQTIIFRDTFSLVPLSVENLGKILNIAKQKTPKCLGRLPNNDAEKQELITYNRRDCLITKRFIEFFQNSMHEFFKTNLEITISRQALIIWGTHYLKFNLHHESVQGMTDEEIKSFLEKAYYGGRCEVFIRGKIIPKDKVRSYDANSLYPFSMKNKIPLPSSAHFTKKPNILHLSYEGVSRAQLSIPTDIHIPPVPYRLNNKLCFPVGTLQGHYTHAELRYFKECGIKVLLLETLYYTKTFYPFNDFVDDMYKKRLQAKADGNEGLSLIYKLILNSLYGKYASKTITETSVFNVNEEKGYKNL